MLLVHTATSDAGQGSLTALDHLLIEKTEEALRDGLQLERWCRVRDHDLPVFPLDLKKKYRLSNQAEGFFDAVEINGKPRSVMGCRQMVELGEIASPNAARLLRDFVLGEFLKRASWTYEDGFPGGFTVEQTLCKTEGGEYTRFPQESAKGCMDWRELGARYSWVLLTVHIHDFVMDFGPFRKRLREAACVAAHADFVHVVENPSPELALEVSIGYPFIEFAPIANFFGFGPGKFGVAVKLFSFFLTRENKVRARLVFAAAPRCRKVFDLGKRWPDPVYGGARLFERLTFGLWNSQNFHNRLDTGMLEQHCRVHQALMDGVETVWKDWVSRAAG